MRHNAISVVIGIAVVSLVALPFVWAPVQAQGGPQAPPVDRPPPPGEDQGTGPAVPEDWPEHWPRPRHLDAAEIRAVESATYLYSTWYGSPQAGLSPAAALAAHRGQQFERFVQFGNRPYLVPRNDPGGGQTFHFVLTQAIVDAAFHLCPDGTWPELQELSPRARSRMAFPNVIGPGDSIRGFSKSNPVHCYWNHMPAADWEGSTLIPPPRFEEVWGGHREGNPGSQGDR